jgi:hypothetical protein
MWGTTGDGDLFLQDEIDETRSFKKLKWIWVCDLCFSAKLFSIVVM